MSNPWHLNLGKLVVLDVFVNVELLKLLAKHYNPSLKAICNPQGEPVIHLSKNAICEVFDLDDLRTVPIVYEDLDKEYWRMDKMYNGWRLPLHRPKAKGPIVPLNDNDGPPFHLSLFS